MYRQDVLPPFVGSTFLKAPSASINAVRPDTVAVVGVPFEVTKVSRPGAAQGPRAIREASFVFDFLMRSTPEGRIVHVVTHRAIQMPAEPRLVDVGDVSLYPTDIVRTGESIRSAVAEIVTRGAFPVILGGDHYITTHAFRGFSEGLAGRGAGGRRLGYICIDSHLDLADDMPLWGKHSSGVPTRRAAESGAVDPTNMVLMGINGYTRWNQWEYAKAHGIHVFTNHDIRSQGIEAIARRAGELASRGTDAIYLSMDIDAVDATYAPGTGQTTIGGMTSEQFLAAVEVLRGLPIGGLDLVEVAPNHDPTGRTAALAASALITLLAPRIFESAS